jgi:ABC-type multidrug transport system fused ATPase/permease subunit
MLKPNVAFVIGGASYLFGLFLILATDSWIMHLFLFGIPLLCIIAGIRYMNEEDRQWRERLRRKREQKRWLKRD